ncbi:MAG TPA: energy transducer TonB [Thermoanaerobaculia bacterium]|nr:energy transducer TonB [Thermoanaerobaculia bacterium]
MNLLRLRPGRCRRRQLGRLGLAVLALLLAPVCGRDDHRRLLTEPGTRRAAAQPAPEPPWLPVHPERQARLAAIPVYGVCFAGTPPRKLAGAPPTLAPESRYRRHGGVLIAHCLIDPEGYVVAVQVMKAPDPADRQAVALALVGWRFVPAIYAGRPAAVHFLVPIPVGRDR